MDAFQDIRFAIRALRRAPGFTATAVLSLGLGFALAACTLAVLNAYLIRGMPFPAADRLYHVAWAQQGQPEPDGVRSIDWTVLADVVEHVDASAPARFYIGTGADLQEAQGLGAAPGSLDILGIRAILGRSLNAGDFAPGADNVALISTSLWRNRFSSDPGIIGRTFQARRTNLADPLETFRIVGVLPPGFRYAREYARGDMEFVVPLWFEWAPYMVRLRPNVPRADAERRITAVVRDIATEMPQNWSGVRLEAVHERYVRGLRPLLAGLTVTAALVLLIIAVNIAVLLMLRALRRQKEVAVRVALGAGRRHVLRLLVAETGLVCLIALAGGLLLTGSTMHVLGPLIEQRLGRAPPGGSAALAMDPAVFTMLVATAFIVTIALSFVPMLVPSSQRLAESLRRDGRAGADGPGMRRARTTLVAVELAASLALLVGSGLSIRTVRNLVRTDLGFETSHLLRPRLALPPQTHPDAPSFVRFYDGLNARLATLPGASFALSNFIPFYPAPRQAVEVDGRSGAVTSAGVLAVSDGYFGLLGMRLIDGRTIRAADRPGSAPVAVISETLARRLWPDGRAIGAQIRTATEPVPNSPLGEWRTVVGVAADVHQTFTDTDLADVYVPFLQAPSRFASLFVRTDAPAAALLGTLRAAVAAIDPTVLVSDQVTGSLSLDAEARRQLAGPRFLMASLSTFAVTAVLLAIIGLYGVTAYAVQQREREVAIRMAVGASRRNVIRLFLRDGGLLLASGLGLGLLGAAGVARLLANQLHGVPPFDLPTLLMASALLGAAGLLATVWPARRAADQNPMAVMKEP